MPPNSDDKRIDAMIKPPAVGKLTRSTEPNGTAEKHTRLITVVVFLAYLLALSYAPLNETMLKLFAEYGFLGSIGFVSAKTLQNLTNKGK
jgi:hypothetical protein